MPRCEELYDIEADGELSQEEIETLREQVDSKVRVFHLKTLVA